MTEQIVDVTEASMPASSDVVAAARSAGGAAGEEAGYAAASALAGDTVSRVAALSSRVDALVASGSDGGDVGTELRDVRVDVDGTVHGSAGEAVRGQVAACSMDTVLTASSILSGTDLIAPRYAYASETGVVRLDGSMELVGDGKYRNTGRVYAGGCGHMHVRTRVDENHFAIACYDRNGNLLTGESVPGLGGNEFNDYEFDFPDTVCWVVVSCYDDAGFGEFSCRLWRDVDFALALAQVNASRAPYNVSLSIDGETTSVGSGSWLHVEGCRRSAPVCVAGCSRVDVRARLNETACPAAFYRSDWSFLPDVSRPGEGGNEYRDYTYDLTDAAYAEAFWMVVSDYNPDGHLGFNAVVHSDMDGEARRYGTFSVLGDSYSTFAGYLADDSWPTYYPASGNPSAVGVDVEDVGQTWWCLFARDYGCRMLENASYSGSTIGYDSYGSGDEDGRQTSFIQRAGKLTVPELIIVFGGTNDYWAARQEGRLDTFLGDYQYSDWNDGDLTKFRPALACLLDGIIRDHIGAHVVFIMNTELDALGESVDTVCDHYGVDVLHLHDIDKASGHPTIIGMRAIADQLIGYLRQH